MYKTYILTYDPVATNYSLSQVHAFVRANALTYQYYSPSLGSYLIKSTSSVEQLVDAYRGFFDGSPYFIGQIFSATTGGALPVPVWNWINSANPPPLIAT